MLTVSMRLRNCCGNGTQAWIGSSNEYGCRAVPCALNAVIETYGSANATLCVLWDAVVLLGAATRWVQTAMMVLLGTAPGGAFTVIRLSSVAREVPPFSGVNTAQGLPSLPSMEAGITPVGFCGASVGSSMSGGVTTWTVIVAVQSS